MKVKIKYSYIYNRQWYPQLSKEEFDKIWDAVLTIGKRFEKLSNEYIERIVDLIPKFSGYKWGEFSEDYITVYLVKIDGSSFSDPLTLKIREDTRLMLVILTHELCHNNMAFRFNNSLEMENVMNLVTIYVFRELDLDVSAQINTLIGFTKKRFKNNYEPLNLDLSKMTVRSYLSQRDNRLSYRQEPT